MGEERNDCGKEREKEERVWVFERKEGEIETKVCRENGREK